MFRDNTKKTRVVNLLHGEVPDVPSELASTGRAAGELRSAVGADQVARVALGRVGGKENAVSKDWFESTEQEATIHDTWRSDLPEGLGGGHSRNRQGTRIERQGRFQG